MKWLCEWFATAKWFLSKWVVLWIIPDAVLVCYAAIITKPILSFHCLFPFVSTNLCEQAWTLGEANERRPPRSPFFQICYGHPLKVSHANFARSFFGHRPNFFVEWPKKLSQIGHNVRKCRLANTVSASFNTINTRHDRQVSANKTGFCIMLKSLWTLIWSEESHMFLKIIQKLCANLPKGNPQELFWDASLKVCLTPLNYNIHPCLGGWIFNPCPH